MRNHVRLYALYANLYTRKTAQRVATAAGDVAIQAQDHKSELACVGVTTVVVGLAARVAGFKAGYEFAQSN